VDALDDDELASSRLLFVTWQLQAMRRQNQTEECLACFDEMLFYGVKPTTKTYDGEKASWMSHTWYALAPAD